MFFNEMSQTFYCDQLLGLRAPSPNNPQNRLLHWFNLMFHAENLISSLNFNNFNPPPAPRDFP